MDRPDAPRHGSRLTVAVSIGLGFGLAVSAALRLAGVWGPTRHPAPAREEPSAAPAAP